MQREKTKKFKSGQGKQRHGAMERTVLCHLSRLLRLLSVAFTRLLVSGQVMALLTANSLLRALVTPPVLSGRIEQKLTVANVSRSVPVGSPSLGMVILPLSPYAPSIFQAKSVESR